MKKPIKVFWSELGNRFYASQHYKIEQLDNVRQRVTITGEKFDVTDDIAKAVLENEIEFTPVDGQVIKL